ncbi:hypothetical protein FF38_03536 [Lucilia cuprina]|uniref:Uncharacterized protein n=1 Tax=Lucilia cuprina TaxID=7375 RepID=A0A0L0CR84_LUCCU|nr:hypothetical protein FF38_03536 [Lucilia cuprina]
MNNGREPQHKRTSICNIDIYKKYSCVLKGFRGNGQMSTLGLETVFISNIVDSVGLTIISNEGVRALDDDSFFISTNILQLTLSLSFNTIAGSKTVKGNQEISFIAFLNYKDSGPTSDSDLKTVASSGRGAAKAMAKRAANTMMNFILICLIVLNDRRLINDKSLKLYGCLNTISTYICNNLSLN